MNVSRPGRVSESDPASVSRSESRGAALPLASEGRSHSRSGYAELLPRVDPPAAPPVRGDSGLPSGELLAVDRVENRGMPHLVGRPLAPGHVAGRLAGILLGRLR